MKVLRRLRRLLAAAGPCRAEPLRAQRRAALSARALVHVFYAANLYLVFRHLRLWSGWRETTALDPLWPVAWVPRVGIPLGVDAILTLLLAGAFAAALRPGWRPARVAVFLGLLGFHAFENSFGKINHSSHGWVLTSLLLIGLPDAGSRELERSRLARQRLLNAFWSAQAMLLLVYSMAGIWKALEVVPQLWRGEVHGLAPTALAFHIAHRLLQTGEQSLLGPFFIEHPGLGWAPFLATLYLQIAAIAVAFRPSLHRLWGAALIGFHFMVYLTMAVSFHPQVLLMGILVLASPFDPGWSWRRRAADLPLLGAVASRVFPGEPGQAQQAVQGAVGSHRLGDL